MNKAEELFKKMFPKSVGGAIIYDRALDFAEAYHQSELKRINKCTCDKCTGRELESLYDDE